MDQTGPDHTNWISFDECKTMVITKIRTNDMAFISVMNFRNEFSHSDSWQRKVFFTLNLAMYLDSNNEKKPPSESWFTHSADVPVCLVLKLR